MLKDRQIYTPKSYFFVAKTNQPTQLLQTCLLLTYRFWSCVTNLVLPKKVDKKSKTLFYRKLEGVVHGTNMIMGPHFPL